MSPTFKTHGSRAIASGLYGLFFISGACALGYQIVWSRMFAFGLGHEIPAVLAVIAGFFAGLAIGAWLFGCWAGRVLRPGRWYAAAEILIGLWGLISALIIPAANEAALRWIGMVAGSGWHGLVSFSVPFLVLLPSTASMGATLPMMERFAAPFVRAHRCVGALYAANTLGAVGGALLSAFVIVPEFGFRGTLFLLGLLNVVSGAIALLVARKGPPRNAEHATPFQPHPEIAPRRLRATLFVTGLLGIGYEVIGLRVLAQVLENTIFTFASVLAIYLLGAAIGAAAYQRFGERWLKPGFGWILCTLALSCALGGWMLLLAPRFYESLRALAGETVAGVMISEMGVAGSVFGLPTIMMGLLFSHLAQASRRHRGEVGWAVALNTVGSAAAPAVFGTLLFPALGAKWSLLLISMAYLCLLPRVRGATWVGVATGLALAAGLPARLQLVQLPVGGTLVEYRDGVMDSVAVVQHFDGHRSLLVNNRFVMGGTGAANAARRHGHIPLLLHSEPRRALFLGLGTGMTFGAARSHEGLRADAVELIPEIPEVLHHFEPHNTRRAGMDIRIADARRFIRTGGDFYDVIVADLFHPARDGAGSLYTVEHFQAIRARLATDGIFCQWLPMFQLDEAMLRVIVKTFIEVFPDARAFLLRFNVDTPALGLVGNLGAKLYPADWLEKRVTDDELSNDLKAAGLLDRFHFFGLYLAGATDLQRFAGSAALNTDDHPVVVFGAPRFAYQRSLNNYGRLLSLLQQVRPEASELIAVDNAAGGKFAEELAEFIAARNIYLRGLALEVEGDFERAIDAYVESSRASVNFSTGYAHGLTIAVQQSKTNLAAAQSLLRRLAEAQPSRPVAKELLERLGRDR